MKDGLLDIRLAAALQAMPPHRETQMNRVMLLAREEMRKKPARGRMRFTAFWRVFLRFIGWKIWLAQAAYFAVGIMLLLSAAREQWGSSPKHMAMGLCALSVFTWMTAIPFMRRANRNGMREIERACCVEPMRWMRAQVATVGLGDGLLIGGLGLVVRLRNLQSVAGTCAYLLLPFLLVSCCCLFLMRHVKEEHAAACCTAVCLLLAALIVPLGYWSPQIFEMTPSPSMGFLCAALLLLCMEQTRHLSSNVQTV